MTWILSEPLQGVYISAENDGLHVQGEGFDITTPDADFPPPLTPLGKRLPLIIPQLLDLGLAEKNGAAIIIHYKVFLELPDYEIYAFEELASTAPFFCELSSHGTLGLANFGYKREFYLGNNKVDFENEVGCFVSVIGKKYCLDRQTYSLVREIELFRRLTPDEKMTSKGLISFAEIRELAKGLGSKIDEFIQGNKVLIAPSLGVDLIEEPNGSISFAPFIVGIPQEALREVFLSSDDLSSLHIDDGAGGRIRVLFSQAQEEALKRMASIRHLKGLERIDVLRNPTAVFDGVASEVDLFLGDFGPRVKAIGKFPSISLPFIKNSQTGIFEETNPDTPAKDRKFDVGIEVTYADGEKERLGFEGVQEVVKFYNDAQSAFIAGNGFIDYKDRSIVLDYDFVEATKKLAKYVTDAVSGKRDTRPVDKDYLLIYENEEQLDYEEQERLASVPKELFFNPKSLRDEIELKNHQTNGLRWMQTNFLMGRKGCLLADDMGLGKTLQVLMFIAWLLELTDHPLYSIVYESGHDPEMSPWNPVLVIMPVILLENEIWQQDMRKFFKGDGEIFYPWLPLYKGGINTVRVQQAEGVMKGQLDYKKIRANRLIFTNYETLVNYQFSLANIKSSWSVIITDEAQAHKTPKSKRSFALKSLSSKFKIACTGTPVETRMLDVWNIIDYLQPGTLGSSQEFSITYEQPIANNPENTISILDALKEKLKYSPSDQLDTYSPPPYILRREKSQELIGLPKKHIHKKECFLAPKQRSRHIECIDSVRGNNKKGAHFAVIHDLMHLYQHPAIHPYIPYEAGEIKRMTDDCPKLAVLLDILKEVKHSGEKALIFTRTLDMQQLLAVAIREEFRQRVDIVNGAAQKGSETQTSSATRKSMIERFRSDPTINFIILSPDVAGVGLTLVEANHVIHYGRWWNPAKESQATDRVYRLGQTKDVHVYYLIAKDPEGEFQTFDEKLDALIDRRLKMANDFLMPLPEECMNEAEFCKDIFENDPSLSESISAVDVNLLTWERFESLIGILEEKTGNRSVVTPRSGDLGIDVVSINGNTVRLIQCKHTCAGREIDTDVIDETINAFDNYRAGYFTDKEYNIRRVIATNASIPPKVEKQCRLRNIDFMNTEAIASLLERHNITMTDIDLKDRMRLNTMSDLSSFIANG
ncbi:MAG: SNF2-related protein [Chlorobiales bacterium]|nr:SNF2-related protein [Chlorobiales bacterium]